MSISIRPGIRALILSAMLVACPGNGERHPLLSLELTSGARVDQLVDSAGPSVVLLYSPSTCFSCGTPLPLWQAVAREGHARLVVLLAEEPTPSDLHNLRIRRVSVAGVIRDRSAIAALPAEFVVRDGKVVNQALGSADVTRQKLWTQFIADSLQK